MKKLISLMLSCLMILSMGIVASAAVATEPTGTTVTVATDGVLYEDPDGNYYAIDVKIDKVYTDSSTLTDGWSVLEFWLTVDNTKFDVHPFLGWGTDDGAKWSGKQGSSWKKYDIELDFVEPTATGVHVLAKTGRDDRSLLQRALGDGTLTQILLMPKEGATGKTSIGIEKVEFTTVGELQHQTEHFILDDDDCIIDLGGEEEGGEDEPVVPENTTVATFPKRLYVNDTLYTVGIITEGKNFATETVKAGINIEKGTEGATVNYWTNEDLVSKAGKSYYAVGLKDVTTTTQITPESASKAVIIVNDAAPVYGAAVTGNSLTTDKDPEIVLE